MHVWVYINNWSYSVLYTYICMYMYIYSILLAKRTSILYGEQKKLRKPFDIDLSAWLLEGRDTFADKHIVILRLKNKGEEFFFILNSHALKIGINILFA